MNKPNTACRVCGKEYFCCEDSRAVNSWRTMACSPECFQEYMRRIEESRKPQSIINTEETLPKSKTTKKKVVKKASEENEQKIDD